MRQLWTARHLAAAVGGVRHRHRGPSTIPGSGGFGSHDELYEYSVKNPGEFWAREARSQLTWSKDFTKAMDCNMREGRFRWFEDGRLNASVNCVDRHAALNPDKPALIWEKDEPGDDETVTYAQLKESVCRIANVLKGRGIGKGDVVAIYMPISPVAVAAMLACARIGAVHSVVFAGFSASAVASRIRDCSAVAVVTADEAVRGGKTIPLRATVKAAMEGGACPSVRDVLVASRTGNDDCLVQGDLRLEELMRDAAPECLPEEVNAEDYLFVLYTSGSTGTPKGLAHSTAGYLLYAAYTQKHVFGCYGDRDVFGCVADIGWITGHSYVVYGPLANGATTLLFESTPTYPDPGRYWSTVERHRVTQFYCAPTSVRMLQRYGDHHVEGKDLSSLRVIGSVGEPINQEAWHWLNDTVGGFRCDVVDTWWQTETGGICIAPRPSEAHAPILPSMAMWALPGIAPILMNEDGEEHSELDSYGKLCLKEAWPGIARTVYGSHERFVETYFKEFPGYYFTGDGAHRSSSGHWQITGRIDDVMNVSGHRIGTAEVESVLDEHDDVVESAVVGCPHDVKGESVFAFVTLSDRAAAELSGDGARRDLLVEDLKASVRAEIAAFAVPDRVLLSDNLPKTRSGKIMRRLLRNIAVGNYDDLGDVSTLADPASVSRLVEDHKKWAK